MIVYLLFCFLLSIPTIHLAYIPKIRFLFLPLMSSPSPPPFEMPSPSESPPTASRKRRYSCPLGEHGPHEVALSGSYNATPALVERHHHNKDPRPLEVGDRLCNAHRLQISRGSPPPNVSMPPSDQLKIIADLALQIHVLTKRLME